jgi:hypothetical protein
VDTTFELIIPTGGGAAVMITGVTVWRMTAWLSSFTMDLLPKISYKKLDHQNAGQSWQKKEQKVDHHIPGREHFQSW